MSFRRGWSSLFQVGGFSAFFSLAQGFWESCSAMTWKMQPGRLQRDCLACYFVKFIVERLENWIILSSNRRAPRWSKSETDQSLYYLNNVEIDGSKILSSWLQGSWGHQGNKLHLYTYRVRFCKAKLTSTLVERYLEQICLVCKLECVV